MGRNPLTHGTYKEAANFFTTPEERRSLSAAEAKELESLRHRCWSDLPITIKDYKRLQELERKLW